MQKLLLLLLFSHFCVISFTQSIQIDSSFGIQGMVQTGLTDDSQNPFGPNMAVLPNGEIIIPGGLNGGLGVKKFSSNGLENTGFAVSFPQFSYYQYGSSVQSDGKALIIGLQISQSPAYSPVIRLNADGGVDPSFGTNGIVNLPYKHLYYSNLFELPDGKIITYGSVGSSGENPIIISRLNSDGRIDSTFGIDGHARIGQSNNVMFIPEGLVQPDGKLLFAGMYNARVMVMRLNPDGSMDATFGSAGILIDTLTGGGEAFCMRLQPDGKILVGGYVSPSQESVIVRYLPNGEHDLTFADQGVLILSDLDPRSCLGLELRPDGKIIMVRTDFKLIQLLENGQIDPDFGDNGVFTYLSGVVRPRTVKLIGNELMIGGRGAGKKALLLRFLLDLNVGIVDPKGPSDPALKVYPNPLSGPFHFAFTLAQKAEAVVTLYDMKGQRLHKLQSPQIFDAGEHDLTLDCPEQLPAGNYVLSLEIAGEKKAGVLITKK